MTMMAFRNPVGMDSTRGNAVFGLLFPVGLVENGDVRFPNVRFRASSLGADFLNLVSQNSFKVCGRDKQPIFYAETKFRENPPNRLREIYFFRFGAL